MPNKVSIFDVDGTLARGFYIVKFADALAEQGRFQPKDARAIKEMLGEYGRSSGYDYGRFTWDVIMAFGKGIRGNRQAEIEGAGQRYIDGHPEDKFPFADGLIALVNERGYPTVVISGSPGEIIRPFARSMGMGQAFTTEYETENGVFTGEVAINGAIDSTKRDVVARYIKDHDVDASASAGFGDSHHDLAFLNAVGYPVALNPNEALAAIARSSGWLACADGDDVLDAVGSYLP